MIVLKIIKMKYFPQLSLKQLFNDRTIATFLLVLFCILFVPIEQSGISTVKVVVMALCPLIFILKNFKSSAIGNGILVSRLFFIVVQRRDTFLHPWLFSHVLDNVHYIL